jgi:hypothetical protein
MEQQILELIEEEVARRVALQLREALKVVSTTYDIPLERLIKDTSTIHTKFCKGVLKSKQRCLKQPKSNGYCGFHQNQIPVVPLPNIERVEAPWQLT